MPDSSPANPSLNDLVGRSLGYPLRRTVQGGISLSGSYQNLEESIRLILKTNIGERVYRPTFGSQLSELVFAPMNDRTLRMVRLYVKEALHRWEPRIVVDAILTEPDPIRGLVTISILYHAKGLHDRRSLVYPFYLTPPGEEEA